MGKIKLNDEQKLLVINILSAKLGDLKARKSHFDLLNEYDTERFPKRIMEAIEQEVKMIEEILPQISSHFKEES